MNSEKFSSDAWRSSVALFLLAVMVAWFGHEMLWGNNVPFFRDLTTYFYPMRFSLAQSLRVGQLPLWDRHVAMGYPLLADFQSGTFYPPHIFYLVLPFFVAIKATFLLHYLIAASGAYILFRSWKYPISLAMIGAILFTLGGTIISLTNVLNHFQAAVWLPWSVLFTRRFLRHQSWTNILLLTMALLVQFLAGSPEIYLMTQALLLLLGLKMIRTEAGVRARSVVLALLGANLLVAGLAMVQIVPTLEVFAESRGRLPLNLNQANSRSLRPLNLLNMLFIDKEVNIDSFTSPQPFFSRQTPFFLSYYMGALIPVGVLFWLYYGSRKEKMVVCGFVTLSLITAMGNYTPFYPFLFTYIPLFRLFRFPEKFFFLIYALVLFISLKGVWDFLRSDHRWKRVFLVPFTFCIVAIVFYVCLRLDIISVSQFVWRGIRASDDAARHAKFSLFLVHIEMQIALTTAILLLLFLKKKAKLSGSLFGFLFVSLVFVDLDAAHRSYQFFLNPEVVYGSNKVLAAPDIEPYRLFYSPGGADVHPSYYVLPKEPPFAEFNSLVVSNLLPNTGVFFGFDYMQEIDALGRWPYTTFLNVANKLERPKLYRLLGALNVRYVTGFNPLPEFGIKLVRALPERHSWLYQIDQVVPRVYMVSQAMEEKDPEKILQRLASVEFNPLKEVMLEEMPFLLKGTELNATAIIKRYENQAVEIHADLNATGILVLADSFYPGWRVYVDGKEERILRANLFFRAVSLSSGKHRVEFRYEPVSFTLGLVVSLVTLCGIVAWSLVLLIQNRGRSRTEENRILKVV
jgi:hypothetical protein